MDIIIKEVLNNQDLKKFINFPFRLYKGNKYWVPPLKYDEKNTLLKEKNPAFEYCDAKYWLAHKNGEVVGRIAGIYNKKYVELWGNKYIRFGWLDFIDDINVSQGLLNAVENWAAENNLEAVHGPLGFTDMDYEGMLVEGFDELSTIATMYNFPYYPVHMEKHGYQKDVDWLEYEVLVPEEFPEKVARIASIVERKYKLRLLKVKKAKELMPYTKEVFEIINDAYQELYGVVPLTEKQIDKYIKQYFGFIKPEFVPVVLDSDGKIAAFGITMPSLSKAFQKSGGKLFPFGFLHILRALKKNDTVDFYLTAVRPDMQSKGVNSILIHEMYKVYKKYNIVKAETNLELETNKRIQDQWKFFENRQHKRRRCYIKHLNKSE